MTTQIKLLLGLLVAAAIGLGVMLFQNDPDPVLTDPESSNPTANQADGNATDLEGSAAAKKDTPTEREPIRVETDGSRASGSGFEQGVQGILVDALDRPVQGAQVYLMPGMGLDSMRMFRQHQEGVRFPPLAETVTGADGGFRVGVRKHVEGKEYEVRVLHPDFCDHKVPSIVLQPLDWWDVGRVQLKEGVTVFGRVTNTNGLPIPDVRVIATDGSGMLNITPAPGREEGLIAKTNAAGDYELRNIDPAMILTLTASAENFAEEQKRDVEVKIGKRHQIDFQLLEGKDIAGTVVTARGLPIRRARVTIGAMSAKSLQTEVTVTDEQGFFLVPGLKEGMYTVIVEADGYLTAEERPIPAGRTDLNITLEKMGTVIVTVVDKNGTPLHDYHCNLKTAFDGEQNYGTPVISKPVKGAENGSVTISGLKPMDYVAEIFASGHAKNFSERFTITAGQAAPPTVKVELNEGGVIHGFVKDSQGQPLGGVTVATMPNGLVENPFTKMFQVPYTITKKSVKTSKTGEFRFDMLYSGNYQLRFDHPEFCAKIQKDVQVQTGQTTAIGDVYIDRGCEVSGIAVVDGKAKGQIRVNISSVSDEKKPAMFSCEAITDNKGRFLITKRLPPGKYEVMAAENVQANVLLMMVQFNKSKQEFHIAPGRESHVLNVRVPKMK